jgi:oligopeptidase A
MTPNPLMQLDGLPAFAEIRPEHVSPAVDELLAKANAALERVTDAEVPADYDAMSAVLDVATERLNRAWGAVGHLNAVANTPELRAAYNENLPKVTEFHTRLGSDERLYAKYKALAAGAETLTAPRRKALSNAMRDFVLGGAELQGQAKARFAQIQERLAELAQKFSEHVLDATDSFSYDASQAEMEGVPADVQQAARQAAHAAGRDAWRLTLHAPSYLPVMQYATHRPLRETMYRAYFTRASELGPPERDNSPLMSELLALRQEEAHLLGRPTFAHVSMVRKMARSPDEVLAFLRDLARRARPYAERDLAELRDFAVQQLGIAAPQPWDLPFAAEKLKEARYAFSEQEVKQYFTEPRVLQGLFRIIETLFEVSIRPDTASVWHDDVRFFRVERGSQLVAQFYLDLYARPGKRPGAWMDDVRGRWLRPEGRTQTPVAQLVCNYAAPVGGRPALLTHDDVITLFHEFGHGLHHMLTQVNDIGVAGISGVEWDAVELPSQFMENFAWEWDVLRHMTRHVDTSAPLPRELFDKMLAAKNFHSGLAMLRQIEFAVFDMRLHSDFDPAGGRSALELLEEVRSRIAVLRPPAYNRFPNSFSHIFAGGYAAGYYSYKWAEVLSADAYGYFEENGILDPKIGGRFLDEILSVGGSRPAAESFRAFRGREPRVEALLRLNGMIAA